MKAKHLKTAATILYLSQFKRYSLSSQITFLTLIQFARETVCCINSTQNTESSSTVPANFDKTIYMC